MLGQPLIEEIAEGMRLIWLPTDKFKTVTLKMYIHQELREDLATKTALLPSVLERGTNSYPDSISLQRELDNLYGSVLSTGVSKRGEKHLMVISLEVVRPEYLSEDKLLNRGINIMGELLSNPLLEEGGFRRSFVNQEKKQLAQEIKSMINNKTSYALERCVQEMCRDERFGIYRLGYLEDLEKIDSQELYTYSCELLRSNPIDIYLVGLQRWEDVKTLINEAFSFSRVPPLKEIPPTEIFHDRKGELNKQEEILPVNQGYLVLGYRTNITCNHELYYPLVFCNGILGGFPHSKLFRQVREEANLAYFVFSRLEKHKGIMITMAGINPVNYQHSLDIMQEQLKAIQLGDISREEMENTRIGLVNQLKAQEDNPHSLIGFYLDASLGGSKQSVEEVIERLEGISVDEVMEAANQIKIDTVYFLHSNEGG